MDMKRNIFKPFILRDLDNEWEKKCGVDGCVLAPENNQSKAINSDWKFKNFWEIFWKERREILPNKE